ncbi:hypothetical protein HDU67_002829 [Dinochytrium kinnereticum]|nr:hypothetical protein HDU67_002829 [Dinochytrium kinnereticum]
MEVDGDDDQIVKEIPVFLAQQLVDSLFLLQYPTRRQRIESPLVTRFKPNGQRFEFDIPLATGSRHYSREKGEHLGTGMNDDAILTAMDVDRLDRELKPLDRITLQSHLLPQASNFFVGTVQDEEFHITQLAAMVQMRPALKYKDKIAEKEKALNQRILADDLNIKKAEDDKIIQRRVIQSDDKDNIRRVKQGQEENAYENEEWITMDFFDQSGFNSSGQYDKLFSMGDTLGHALSKTAYLDAICPTEAHESKSPGAIIRRKDFNEAINMSHAMATNMIGELAYFSINIGWKLKLTSDDDFCTRFPDVVSRQAEIVASEASNHAESKSNVRKEEPRRVNVLNPSALTNNSRPVTNDQASSGTNKRESYNLGPGSFEVQIENVLRQILVKYGVCCENYITRRILEQYDQLGEDVSKPSPDDILSVIESNCILLHGRYALKKLKNSLDEFREPILQLFREKTTVKKAEVNSACQSAIGKNPPQNTYQKIMKELAISTGPGWELKIAPTSD